MKEDLLQFIWQHKLLKPVPLKTVSGKPLVILKTGELNHDSGPDFFNARIQLDGLTLAGNVEIHVCTSDWLKHRHQNDRTYDNLILHAVFKNDVSIDQNKRFNVEVLELKNYINEETLNRYQALLRSKQELPCSKQLSNCEPERFLFWLNRILIERLEEKTAYLENLYDMAGKDLAQTFYVSLLSNFGFKLNRDAFELLSRSLPLQILLRHADQRQQVEALLLGMAGLLNDTYGEKYPQLLQNEFEFLSRKYRLVPLDRKLLKYSKTRPNNFPDLRLAQFAALLCEHPAYFQSPFHTENPESLIGRFQVQAGPYWQDHFRLGSSPGKQSARLGKSSAEILVINSLVPFLFFYSQKQHKPECRDLAMKLLETCEMEWNRKTRLFEVQSKGLKTAGESQACIQLFDRYCSKKRCLNCGIAAELLKAG